MLEKPTSNTFAQKYTIYIVLKILVHQNIISNKLDKYVK